MPIALFIGRFQPLHKGHIKVIEDALKKYEKVLIGIGSSKKSREERNPFSYEERKNMLELVFSKEIKENKIEIFGIEDRESDEEWTNEIINKINFDVIITGSDWVEKCFENRKQIEKIEEIEAKILSGTNIRKMMKEGEEWEKWVDERVAKYIKKIALKEFFNNLKV